METKEVLKKHEVNFNRIRLYIKILIGIVLLTIAFIQYDRIENFFKWAFN